MAAREALVVEDDEGIRTLIREVLEADGFVVSEAADGAEALHLLAKRLPDLVVTDWQMPRTHGRHVVAATRELSSRIPVVVLSGDTGRAREEFDPNDPRLHVITKPFDLAALSELVRATTGAV